MCGFVGGFHVFGSNFLEKKFDEASKLLSHRGPDQHSKKIYHHKYGIFAVAHRRLSIIDLSENALQPMVGSFEESIIAYNGELYNYIEIREELKSLGLSFNTESDTEVVLKSLETWGTDALKKFNGMFSFVYFDGNKNEIIIARDRFGIKPLFYKIEKGNIFFASEIPALLKASSVKPIVNKTAILNYINMGVYRNSEETFFKNIQAVLPGSYLKVNLSDNLNDGLVKRSWSSKDYASDTELNFKDAIHKVRECFIDEVRLQLRSDVPIALTLSGGIDSSAIACVVRQLEPDMNIKTFSFNSNKKINSEKKWFDKINNYIGADPCEIKIDNTRFLTDINDLIRTQAEPFVSTSIYAQYCVHRQIADSGIKVVLGGQGADEMFGGYTGYPFHSFSSFVDTHGYISGFKFLLNNKKLFGNPIIPFVLSFIKNKLIKKNTQKNICKNYKFLKGSFIKEFDPNIINNKFNSPDSLQAHLMMELTENKIPILLRYEDRNSMRWSIESRVPYLNPNILKLSQSLPHNFLVSKNSITKYIFREAMRGIVPNEILDRIDKVGFETPEKDLLRENFKTLKEILIKKKDIPFIDKNQFIKFFEETVTLDIKYDPIVWRIINLYLWSDIFDVIYD